MNEWTEISVGRSKNGVGFLQIDNGAEISEPRLAARAQSIFLKTPLYVGGYDKRILLNQGLEVSRGFDGCITGVSIFNLNYLMYKSFVTQNNEINLILKIKQTKHNDQKPNLN